MANTKIRLIIFFATKDGEALYSQQKQDLELTVAQIISSLFRLKLNKVGKTTRPFRYVLNQIPYDYTVEVMNRFRGLAHVTNLNPSRPAPTGNTSQLRKPHVHIKIFQLSFV